jgi:hypothetical protein
MGLVIIFSKRLVNDGGTDFNLAYFCTDYTDMKFCSAYKVCTRRTIRCQDLQLHLKKNPEFKNNVLLKLEEEVLKII